MLNRDFLKGLDECIPDCMTLFERGREIAKELGHYRIIQILKRPDNTTE